MAKPRTPLHTRSRPLSELDLRAYRTELKNLQGNILKGHGRDHTVQIFIEFRRGKQAAAKKWLADLSGQLTSMQCQLEEQHEYSAYRIPGSLFHSVLLTAAGYEYLGFETGKFDPRFQAGMKKSRTALSDPPVDQWEKPYHQTIHCMILLADDGELFIDRYGRDMINRIKAGNFARVLTVERGAALRNVDGQTVEHFGYIDGRSQPVMLAADLKKELKRENLKKFQFFNPEAGPNLVLVPDPFGGSDAYGSYFVYRKLEQNVRGFKRKEKEMAVALGLTGPRGEIAGAMAVGRFERGNPVTLDDDEDLPAGNIIRNDFNYKLDREGAKCPFHSHIRKTNPRGSTGQPLAEERSRRIARRGITYGERTQESFEDEDLMPENEVGLLFMCFQADIAGQFEFMQASFANNRRFPQPKSGLDPVIGQGGKGAQRWPRVWGKPDPRLRTAFDFSGFVTMKGGDYFFAPSISFLACLGEKT